MLRTTPSGDLDVDRFDRSRGACRFHLVAPECAVLEGRKIRRIAGKRNIGGELALEHLAGEQQLAAFVLVADGVADERAVQRGGKLGSEVAHLVGVRHQHQSRLLLLDELLERRDEAVGSVGLQLCRLQVVDLRDFLAGDFFGDLADAVARDRCFQRPAGFGGQTPARR